MVRLGQRQDVVPTLFLNCVELSAPPRKADSHALSALVNYQQGPPRPGRTDPAAAALTAGERSADGT